MKSNIKKMFKKNSQKPKLDQYWLQNLSVKIEHDREKVFKPYLSDKDVLHIGCTDNPIFNPDTNLHIKISSITKTLDGMDLDKEGLKTLNNLCKGNYYTSLMECSKNKYDTILVPETIEHVENIGIFLKEINSLNADTYIITGPNAFNEFARNPYYRKDSNFTEAVHPDHNCWFSPYTLKNVIEKYTELTVNDVFLCNYELMVVCICTKK
jgi:hypothetical protein